MKMPKGAFKPSQVEWRQKFRGPEPITLRSIQDAERFMLLAMETPQ